MEITNINKYHAIPFIVGEPIAQIVFFKLDEQVSFTYSEKGHYQTSTYMVDGKVNIQQLKENWSPKDMLPKLYKSKSWK